MSKVKAIETYYNGYRFRSRAEARWAVFFDACNIKYMYEPEGLCLSDGTLYLPDFYLPESKTYFEVKGIMNNIDMHKIKQLQKDLCVSVAIGYADMTFQASNNYDWGGEQTFEIADKDESYVIKCPDCGKVFFMGNTGYYGCQCCGYYDGDSIFSNAYCGDGSWFGYAESFTKAFNYAKQARFEHGDTPQKYQKQCYKAYAEPLAISDEELIKRASESKEGFLFKLLFSGSWNGIYPNQNDADLELCKMFAFWTGCDKAVMDRLFRASGLMRLEWDKQNGSMTYGETVIEKAIGVFK